MEAKKSWAEKRAETFVEDVLVSLCDMSYELAFVAGVNALAEKLRSLARPGIVLGQTVMVVTREDMEKLIERKEG